MLLVLEAVVQTAKSLLVIAEDVKGEALASLVVDKLRDGLQKACEFLELALQIYRRDLSLG
ncbi:hypothetical protein [Sinorhizobium meliloti]|uniref:hypothetical protein n=1 Tax=Rhizobium meliloti TaxID=382 RepID=UPI000400D4B5|nr:hypothetical protein [Sinorhizobium meliloti]